MYGRLKYGVTQRGASGDFGNIAYTLPVNFAHATDIGALQGTNNPSPSYAVLEGTSTTNIGVLVVAASNFVCRVKEAIPFDEVDVIPSSYVYGVEESDWSGGYPADLIIITHAFNSKIIEDTEVD